MPAEITVHGAAYPHTEGIGGVTGDVRIRHKPLSVAACFRAVLAGEELDAVEFSLANFLMLHQRKATHYVALPVFPYRAFRHDIVRVPIDSPLARLAELRGKTVAVPDYSMTAAVWARGLIEERIPGFCSEVEWLLKAPQRFEVPAGVAHRFGDLDAETAVKRGLAAALLSPDIEDDALPADRRQLRPLGLAEGCAEAPWALDVGFFPINHLVLVHRNTLRRVPGAAALLVERFSAALGRHIGREGAISLLPAGRLSQADALAAFGHGFFGYGMSSQNERNLAQFARYLHAQGLVSHPPDIRSLFSEYLES